MCIHYFFAYTCNHDASFTCAIAISPFTHVKINLLLVSKKANIYKEIFVFNNLTILYIFWYNLFIRGDL